jgi:hypothetical protein
VPISEKLFIGGDLNGHVGSTRVGFDGVHEGFGYGSRNQEGEDILNFALAYDLIVENNLFRKKVSHLVTCSSGQHCSQIDFNVARREDRHAYLDYKVIPVECVMPQHKLVAAKTFKKRVLKEGPWYEGGHVNSMWMKKAICIRKVALQEFRVIKGAKCETKETWC